MKLYERAWSIYPRRIGIYLIEKGLDRTEAIERIDASSLGHPPGRVLQGVTPAGTVPALATDGGTIIGSSIAILEYLEECFPDPDMLGATAVDRAMTRERVSVADEAAVHLGGWVHHASRLFAGRATQNGDVARAAMAEYHATLRLLEALTAQRGTTFLAGSTVTIADCVAFSLLQTAGEFFGVTIGGDCPRLRDWYALFAARPSGAAPGYPAIVAVARGLVAQTGEM